VTRLKGYFVDYLEESENPNFKFKYSRKYFSFSQKEEYQKFIEECKSNYTLITYGERNS